MFIFKLTMFLQFIKLIVFSNILVFCASSLGAQTLVGISNNTIAISPSNTLTNNSNFAVTGYVKNIGTTIITDDIHVNLAIDNSTTSTPNYVWRSTTSYPTTNILPGNTFSFSVTDVASTANLYKGGGGGTTIVVWTKAGAVTNTTLDSVFSSIYLIDVPAVGINQLDAFEASPIYIQNPAAETIHLNYDESIYTKVELNSIEGTRPKVLIHTKTLSVNNLAKGLYLLRFWNEKEKYYITKKIIIE